MRLFANLRSRIRTKATLPVFRGAAAVVTAAGATIALFGEPRANGSFTSWGYVALSLIVSGFAFAIAIEVLQYGIETRAKELSDLERRVRSEWRVVEHHRLASISIGFNHRVQMPVTSFMAYIGGVVFRLSGDSEIEPGITTRNLRFDRVNDDVDLETAYALTASDSKDSYGRSNGISFYRAETELEIQLSPSTDSPEVRNPPNEESSPRLYTKTSRIEAITMIVGGGEWGYTTSNQDIWTDPQQLACGVYASLEWSDLQLGLSYRTITDLGHLRRLSVVLPKGFNLRPVDEFRLTLVGSGGVVASIDLESRRFALREDGGWETGLSGPELYTEIESDFFDERMRNLTGFYDELAKERLG